MSLRKAAGILGISHAYLSQIKNGRRPLPDALKGRIESLGAYHLLTTGTESGRERPSAAFALGGVQPGREAVQTMVGVPGFEPGASCSHASY